MKKNISRNMVSYLGAMVCVVVALTGCAPKHNYSGAWSGTASINLPPSGTAAHVPVIFHVTKKDDGSYSATLDIVSFKMTGVPVQTFTADGSNVNMTVQIATQKVTFEGAASSETEIDGKLTQDQTTTPLQLAMHPEPK
jgi:hypothetical protein